MPRIFLKNGHSITGLIFDVTKDFRENITRFKFLNANNFELSWLMLSHDKNT